MQSNLWHATSREHIETKPLDAEMNADLVIIGGGFTGCSAALHAAQTGMSVVLLEAETIGYGGSGRNVGLVNAGLWLPPDAINLHLGSEAGERLTALLGEAPQTVFTLIERYDIDCEPVRNGTLHCACHNSGLNDLRERHRQLSARGAPVTLLDAEETGIRTGTSRFAGALHDARAGTIQPLAYCRGLARAAQAAGASLHERSQALSISRGSAQWRVKTRGGSVRAAALVMATNAYHMSIEGAAKPQTVLVHYFQMATQPLAPQLRETLLPGGEGCWDTASIMSSFRLDQTGRLIIGAMGSLDGPLRGFHRGWASRKLAQQFPHLAGQQLEHAWCGRIAMTGDHLPKIQRLGPRGYAAFGYSGRGIGPGTVFGKSLAQVIVDGDEDALPVRAVDAHAETAIALKAAFFESAAASWHFFSAR